MRTVVHASRALGRHSRAFTLSMSVGLTEDQVNFVDTAGGFADTHIEPNAAKWDREKLFPRDQLREAAGLGLGAMYVQEPYGTGLTRFDSALVFERIAQSCPSTSAYLSIHNMCCWMVDTFGSDALKAELLPKMSSMEWCASYCLTEPSSGSDAASLKTIATDCGDHYEVSGSKAFISGAGDSDVYIVMCRTGTTGPKGISCLAIKKGLEGFSFGKNEYKMGWCNQATRTCNFDKVKVPKSMLVGKEGDGFKYAMKGLDGGRINIAACSLGGAQRCLDLALQYSKDRTQFSTPIAEFQNTQFRLAEMATNLHASRLMVRQAAAALDAKDPDATSYCAMAKMQATEQCFNIVDQALQLHGGYGYLQDFPVERYLRDLRVHRILEGTNEVMRHIVARSMLN